MPAPSSRPRRPARRYPTRGTSSTSSAPKAPRKQSVTKGLWNPILDQMDAAKNALKAAHPTPRTDGPTDFEHVLVFTAPADIITGNKLATMGETNYAIRAAWRRPWRETARDAAWRDREALAPLAGCPVEITVAVPRKDAHWVDEANFIESLSKAIVDGIGDAGVLMWDDHTKPGHYTWVTVVQPKTWIAPADRLKEIRVRIRHATERWENPGQL